MEDEHAIDSGWSALMSALPTTFDLDATAQKSGALARRRAVKDGATLLRLALAYGPGELSLRSAAAWAGLRGVAQLSDVALMKRLRGAADWLGMVAGSLLHTGQPGRSQLIGRTLRIADGSLISTAGSDHTTWRLHATYDPQNSRFTHLELTDIHGGESLDRVPLQTDEVVLGDRSYAKPRSLARVLSRGAGFIVRVGWTTLRLTTLDGALLEWEALYASLKPGEILERQVLVEYSGKKGRERGKPLFQARLIVLRKDEAATAREQKRARRRNQKSCMAEPQSMTLTSAGFLMVLTSLPVSEATASQVLDTYRVRWQVELAFKRLKSGLGIDKLRAKGSQLARSWLFAHLILALLIDEATHEVLDSPPCAPDGHYSTRLAMAAPSRPSTRFARQCLGKHFA